MKSSSCSSSLTSSTSSSVSFESNLYKSKTPTSSCIGFILRRILCSTDLPQNPSDQIIETSNPVFIIESKSNPINPVHTHYDSPGIIARLMGLDSNPGSIRRSKSMNCVEFKTTGETHRRVKSSSSPFRESPSFLEIEDNYLTLNFDSESDSMTEREFEKGFGEFPKPRKSEKRRNRHSVKTELSKNKKETKCCVELECNNNSEEDSSPVSVLDFDRFNIDQQQVFDSENEDTNTRRKLSPILENHIKSFQREDKTLMEDEERRKNNFGSIKIYGTHYLEMRTQISKILVSEISESNLKIRRVSDQEEFYEINVEVESLIINQLLEEIVDQLYSFNTVNT